MVSQIKLVASDFAQLQLVYLFGSQVSGNTGPLSDFDLGILLNQTNEEETIRVEIAHRLAKGFGTNRVDVILMNHVPVTLAFNIIAQGECIYQIDAGTRVEYEAQVLSKHGDYLPVLIEQRDDILRGDKDGQRVQRYREALRRTERTLSQIRSAQE